MADSLNVVLLDDNIYDIENFERALQSDAMSHKFKLEVFQTADTYRKRIAQKPRPDMVVLDIHMSSAMEKSGIALASETKKLCQDTVVVMRSTSDDALTISECLRAGADDFLSKHTDKGELCHRLDSAFKFASLKSGTAPPKIKVGQYAGATLSKVAARIPNIIDSAVSCVHIFGESGTGKEVIAELFSANVGAKVPFVKVNCGGIAPNLLESELFGHKKGAFTGATTDRKGIFETANGGWVFLDEVAVLSPTAQAALLRVVENKELCRLGSTTPIKLNIRILTACNEDLEALSKTERFRQDLWQRFSEVRLSLPPLRDRIGEIQPLIEHFCKTMEGGPYSISGPAVKLLASSPWKQGNVRELRNCLRAMTEFSSGKLLTPLSIPKWVLEQSDAETTEEDSAPSAPKNGGINLQCDKGDAYNYDYLAAHLLLELTELAAKDLGKLSLRRLATLTGISRSRLTDKLRGLVENDFTTIEKLAKLVNINM